MEDILLVMENFEDYIKERYLISEQLFRCSGTESGTIREIKECNILPGWIYRIYADPEKSTGKAIKDWGKMYMLD